MLTLARVERDPELERRAWEAWDRAWDRAKVFDERRGRPYDRHRYARLAHLAFVRISGKCRKTVCHEHKRGDR